MSKMPMPILLCCWACYRISYVTVSPDGYMYCPNCDTAALFLEEGQTLKEALQGISKTQDEVKEIDAQDLLALLKGGIGTSDIPLDDNEFYDSLFEDEDLEDDEYLPVVYIKLNRRLHKKNRKVGNRYDKKRRRSNINK